MKMRFIHRIRVEGTCPAADWLRLFLHRCSYTLVPDSSYGFMVTIEEGPELTLDSVDSPLERKILEHLQEQDEKHHADCGTVRLLRAGGNQDAMRAVITVPTGNLTIQKGVATAVLNAILQASEQDVPEIAPGASPQPPQPLPQRRPRWKLWSLLG